MATRVEVPLTSREQTSKALATLTIENGRLRRENEYFDMRLKMVEGNYRALRRAKEEELEAVAARTEMEKKVNALQARIAALEAERDSLLIENRMLQPAPADDVRRV